MSSLKFEISYKNVKSESDDNRTTLEFKLEI